MTSSVIDIYMLVHWLQTDTQLKIKVAASATTEILQQLITSQTGVPADEQRLICNQCELQPGMTLDEQNIKTNSIATLLEQPEERVCPEWLATGRCHLKSCCLRATHTMEYSPRYLAHHIKSTKQTPPATQPQQMAPQAAPFVPQASPTSKPFTILQPPLSSEPPMLSPSATPFMMNQQRLSWSDSCSPPRSQPTLSPKVVPFVPSSPDSATPLSPAAVPFVLPCRSPRHASQLSWDCGREVPVLSIPPQQQHVASSLTRASRVPPAIGTPLNQPVTSPRLIDSPISSACTSQRRSSLPWDCTQDAELVGGAPVHRPVGTIDSSTMGSIWSTPQNAASSLQWSQMNYGQETKRGLKREAGCQQRSPRGDEIQRVRWAEEPVQLCELTSVREFHLDSSTCLATEDLEMIFERCGMRVPVSPSVAASHWTVPVAAS